MSLLPTDTGQQPAVLVLEDGTAFRGWSVGAGGTALGEAVFNTGMTGYQEVMTDPSYRRQIVALTAAQVGNYGFNDADMESSAIQAAGLVVRSAARRPSSWRSQQDLGSALRAAGTVAIEGVDTRRLTRHLREHGTMRAGLSTDVLDTAELAEAVRSSPPVEGVSFTSEVTTAEPYVLAGRDSCGNQLETPRGRLVAVDFGMKRSLGRQLSGLGFEVHVVPAATAADDILALEPDGVFLSNGPGDPAAVTDGITTTRALLDTVPLFGICLGSQLLGLALGASTYRLRFGHRGMNQPVLRRADGRVEITSHNHGFAVAASTLGTQRDEYLFETDDHGLVEVSHVNLNDDVVEGLVARDVQAFGVQYHPEGAPGPTDARYLFTRFADMVDGARRGQRSTPTGGQR